MSKKESAEVVPQQADMSTLLTALIALLAANRVADHREGRESLNPQLGKVDEATARAISAKQAKLDDAERAVKQSKFAVREAIAKAEDAEVNLRDVREAASLPDFDLGENNVETTLTEKRRRDTTHGQPGRKKQSSGKARSHARVVCQ